ncbi:MAG: DUF58 domain-containing protein [Candidatus Nanohalobium sp.]
MESREYGRYEIATPFTVILAFLGLLTGSTAFYVAAAIPALYILASSLYRKPDSESLSLERNIENEAPSPGEEVEVTVKVRNTGKKTLTDLRLIDSVPEGLKVVDGSPRASVAVAPGSSASFSYKVVARRGRYVFSSVKAVFRSRGSEAFEEGIDVSGDDLLECKTGLEQVVLRDKTEEQVGSIVTSDSGEGLEFHSLRDYKGSDPLSRVEWRHLAKTGELATKNFREERSGRIVLVVDARKVSDVKAGKGHPSAVDLSGYAAERMFTALLKSRHKIGAGVIGENPEDYIEVTESSLIPYVKPGRGSKTRSKIQTVFKKIGKGEKNKGEGLETSLYKVLPPNSQVIFFSPLLDDEIQSVVKTLESHGFPSIVVSPDVTYGDNHASRLEKVKREIRMKQVRKHAPVINWNIKQPMSIQVSKALRRIYGGDIG